MNAEEKTESLAKLTYETVEGLATDGLRMAAETMLNEYSYRKDVATIQMTDSVFGFRGAMSAIDELMGKLYSAYRGMEPRVSHNYGSVVLSVWHNDETLRTNLKYYADRARVTMMEQEEQEENA